MNPARLAGDELAARLRLIVVTDQVLAHPREVGDVVDAALSTGAPAVQLREKALPPRDVLPLARRLRAATRAAEALFFVNDRLDLALAIGADGVHLGSDDLPVEAARRIAPPGFLIGYSADDSRDRPAPRSPTGADYIGCGAVFPTIHQEATPGRAVGLDGSGQRWSEAVDAPRLWRSAGIAPASAPLGYSVPVRPAVRRRRRRQWRLRDPGGAAPFTHFCRATPATPCKNISGSSTRTHSA